MLHVVNLYNVIRQSHLNLKTITKHTKKQESMPQNEEKVNLNRPRTKY